MDHISFTQLNMLLRCGEQYNRRYVKGEILAPSGSMVRGRSCHKAEEKNYIQKVDSTIDLPLEEVRQHFADTWERSKYEIQWTKEELGDESPTKVEAKYKDSGIDLISVYHKDLAPRNFPIGVEQKFTVSFEGGYPNLEGIIDRIDQGDIVTDMKFQAKSPTADDILKDIQLTAYDLGFRNKFQKKPTKLKKEFSISTKVPKTLIQEADPREDEVINRFLFRLEKAMEIIQKGSFQPAPIGAWWCDPRYCGYYQTCKYRP